MLKLVTRTDLKSVDRNWSCGFESHSEHIINPPKRRISCEGWDSKGIQKMQTALHFLKPGLRRRQFPCAPARKLSGEKESHSEHIINLFDKQGSTLIVHLFVFEPHNVYTKRNYSKLLWRLFFFWEEWFFLVWSSLYGVE